MIYHLLYISEEKFPFSSEALKALLDQSRDNNQKKSLTGILIKNGAFFIQLLEGKKENVTGLYDIIAQDTRHGGVRTLMTFQDNNRIFPDWSMGFVEGKDHDLKVQELIPLIHQDVLKQENSRDRVISVLKKFNQI